MRLRNQIILGYFVIALLTAVVGLVGIAMLNLVDREIGTISKKTMPVMEAIDHLRYSGMRIDSSTNEICILLDEEEDTAAEVAKEKALIRAALEVFTRNFAVYERIAGNHNAEEAETARLIQANHRQLLKTSAKLIALKEHGNHGRQFAVAKHAFEAAEQAYFTPIEEAHKLETAEFEEQKEDLERARIYALKAIMVLSMVTFALALLCGYYISRSISKPLMVLTESAEAIGKGDLERRITVTSRDEVGELAATFNRMAAELKDSHDQMSVAQTYLNNIINSMADALLVVAPDGAIKSVNRAACTLLGYGEAELVGQPFALVLVEAEPGKELLADFTQDGAVKNDRERVYRAKDGRRIPVAFSVSGLVDAGGLLQGYVCLAQDITERKQAEEKLQRYAAELKQSNEEVLSFASIVSHDLRAPLVSIKGFSAELGVALKEAGPLLDPCFTHLAEADRRKLETILKNDVQEALEFIGASVNRMDGLITAILNLSRLGRKQLTPEVVPMKGLVQNILDSLAHQLEAKWVSVSLAELPEITADKVAMEQIMGNLLDNALKYMTPGRAGELSIFAERGRDEITFHVRDNGRGIADEDMHKVFELFRRAGQQDTTGEGMGLAYVKTLVRRHGGRIWCESAPGVGSTFSFTLPVPCSM